MNFYESVAYPILNLIRYKGEEERTIDEVKRLFESSEMYCNLFAGLHDLDENENQIGSLPQEEKVKLWEESVKAIDRIKWCKAVHVYRVLVG